VPVPPERDLSGEWVDKATGISGAHLFGMHLRLPGFGDDGPTLEIFQYGSIPEHPSVKPNTPGFAHIAFAVDDVAAAAQAVFNHGGSAIGELTVREVPGVGLLTFQYLADPEGTLSRYKTGENKEGQNMSKIKIDSGAAFLYPMPMVLVGSVVEGKANFMAAAWVSRVNFKPP